MDGALLSGIALNLDFHYNSREWEFAASLSVKSKYMQDEDFSIVETETLPTVRAILTELVGDDSLPSIPCAMMDIPGGRPGKDGWTSYVLNLMSLDTSKIGPAEFLIEAVLHLIITEKNAKGL